MIGYISQTTNPYFNLASEEFFLKNYPEEIFFLWKSEPSVIVGKHQNAVAEINVPYVFSKKIPVIRRISGGGTVFHDLGNLNFCFIFNGKQGQLVDYDKYTLPIVSFLRELGINARFDGKFGIRADGLKLSGNAEHVYKNRVLHHGTLLFDSNLTHLDKVLKIIPGKYSDKSVQSTRVEVGNIADLLGIKLTIDEFTKELFNFLSVEFNCKTQKTLLLPEELADIERLISEKYTLKSWNFGYSPLYSFCNQSPTSQGHVRVEMDVKEGKITKICLTNISLQFRYSELELMLVGRVHHFDDLLEEIGRSNLFTTEEILKLFF
jgi:lipoate---protein ligase